MNVLRSKNLRLVLAIVLAVAMTVPVSLTAIVGNAFAYTTPDVTLKWLNAQDNSNADGFQINPQDLWTRASMVPNMAPVNAYTVNSIEWLTTEGQHVDSTNGIFTLTPGGGTMTGNATLAVEGRNVHEESVYQFQVRFTGEWDHDNDGGATTPRIAFTRTAVINVGIEPSTMSIPRLWIDPSTADTLVNQTLVLTYTGHTAWNYTVKKVVATLQDDTGEAQVSFNGGNINFTASTPGIYDVVLTYTVDDNDAGEKTATAVVTVWPAEPDAAPELIAAKNRVEAGEQLTVSMVYQGTTVPYLDYDALVNNITWTLEKDVDGTWEPVSANEATHTPVANALNRVNFIGHVAGEYRLTATLQDSQISVSYVITVDDDIITFDQYDYTMYVGEELQLEPILKYINEIVTYTMGVDGSDAPLPQLTVSNNGLVKAVQAGSSYIKVKTDSSVTKILNFTVLEPVDSVAFAYESITIREGDVRTFVPATVLPADAADKDLVYTSSDDTIFSVSNNEQIKGEAVGQAVLTATAHNGKTDSVIVYVVPADTQMFADPSSLALYPEESKDVALTFYDLAGPLAAANLDIEYFDDQGADITGASPVEYRIKGTDVTQGTVVAAANTSAYYGKYVDIVLSYEDTSAEGIVVNTLETTIRVTFNVPLAEIEIYYQDAEVDAPIKALVDAALQLTVDFDPANATDKGITWQSSNPTVATVDANGLVTCVGVGTAMITATSDYDGSITDTVKVVVDPTVFGIAIVPAITTAVPGQQIDLDVVTDPEGMDLASMGGSLEWSILGGLNATITQTGLLTINNALEVDMQGKLHPVTVEAAYTDINGNEYTAFLTINVTPQPKELVIVNEERNPYPNDVAALWVGDLEPLFVQGYYTAWQMNASENQYLPLQMLINNPDVIWTSLDPSIAKVDQAGHVRAVSEGTVMIRASLKSDPSVNTCLHLTVKQSIDGLNVPATRVDLWPGQTLDFVPVLEPVESIDQDNFTVTNPANPDIAYYNMVTKQIEAVGPGTVTVTFTYVKRVLDETTGKYTDVDQNVLVQINVLQPANIVIDKDNDKPIDDDKVTAMRRGEIHQLGVTLTGGIHERPDNQTEEIEPSNKQVKWFVLDESVAKIDDNGKLTFLKEGRTLVYAVAVNNPADPDDDVHDSIEIVMGLPDDIVFIDNPIYMYVGDTHAVEYLIPEEYIQKQLTWTSSDTDIFTLPNGKVGRIRGEQKGTALLTVEIDGTDYKSSVVVFVLDPIVVAIDQKTDDADDYDVIGSYAGETIQLTATVTHDDWAPMPQDLSVTWTSSNTGVATVDPVTGLLTINSINGGSAVITATSNADPRRKDTIVVGVGNRELVQLNLTENSASLYPNETAQILPYITPDSAVPTKYSYEVTGGDTVIKVNEYGLVTALTPGTGVVEVAIYKDTPLEQTLNFYVNVKQDVTDMTLNDSDKVVDGKLTLYVDEYYDLKVTFNDGLTDPDDESITWIIDDPSILEISPQGKALAKKVGFTWVWAEAYNGMRAEIGVTVIRAPKTITLSVEDVECWVGDKVPVDYTFSPEDTTEKGVTWTSSDPTVAYYDETIGCVVALKAGLVTITVTSTDPTALDVSDSMTVWVKQPATGIQINSSVLEKYVGDFFQLKATVLPEGDFPMGVTIPTVVWSTSNPEVAIVDEFGVVTALKPGTTTIYANTHNGLQDTIQLTVLPLPQTWTGVTTASNLFIRKGPGVKEAQLGSYPKGTTVTIYSMGNGDDGLWYEIVYNGQKAFIHSYYVKDVVAIPYSFTDTQQSNAKVGNCETTTIYNKAGSGYETTAPKNTRLFVIGESGSYYKVRYGTNMVGEGYILKAHTVLDYGFQMGVPTQTVLITNGNPNGYVSTTPQITTVTVATISAPATWARANASLTADVVANLTYGTKVILNSQIVNGFYQIIFDNGQVAWVQAEVLSDFATTLKSNVQLGNTNPDYVVDPKPETPAPATVTGTVNTSSSGLNVRSGASTSSKVLASAAKGSTLTILETVGSWYKVRLSTGLEGYVSAQYVVVSTGGSSDPGTSTTTMTVATSSSSLNVRSAPNGSLLGSAKKGSTVTVLDASNSSWYKVKTATGLVGYVSSSYLK